MVVLWSCGAVVLWRRGGGVLFATDAVLCVPNKQGGSATHYNQLVAQLAVKDPGILTRLYQALTHNVAVISASPSTYSSLVEAGALLLLTPRIRNCVIHAGPFVVPTTRSIFLSMVHFH